MTTISDEDEEGTLAPLFTLFVTRPSVPKNAWASDDAVLGVLGRQRGGGGGGGYTRFGARRVGASHHEQVTIAIVKWLPFRDLPLCTPLLPGRFGWWSTSLSPRSRLAVPPFGVVGFPIPVHGSVQSQERLPGVFGAFPLVQPNNLPFGVNTRCVSEVNLGSPCGADCRPSAALQLPHSGLKG